MQRLGVQVSALGMCVRYLNSCESLESFQRLLEVIPAKAGIQFFYCAYSLWTPAFAGVTAWAGPVVCLKDDR
jgi:hypothetical protein